MSDDRQTDANVPIVGWQGSDFVPFELLRLENVVHRKPRDGHNPEVPHRIGFHAMMLVTKGKFRHWLDFGSHMFMPNHLIYIAPHQVHRFLKHQKGCKVWALIFRTEGLLAELSQVGSNHDPWGIMCYRWPSVTMLSSADAGLMRTQLESLEKLTSMSRKKHGCSANYHACSTISLALELAMAGREATPSAQANERFFAFVRLMEKSYTKRHDVKWYVEQLDCSQRTLNRDCTNATGKSAKTLVTERVVIEAKRLLTYSDATVEEISFQLGFSTASNFVRFFKKETNTTPAEFRSVQV